MGTMGGVEYEVVMLHQQMAKKGFKSLLSHRLLFSQCLSSFSSIRRSRMVPLALLLYFSSVVGDTQGSPRQLSSAQLSNRLHVLFSIVPE